MKTYYLIKSYAANERLDVERFLYFGKQQKLLGYICEEPYGVQRYSKEDIQKYGFRSFNKAQDAAKALASQERDLGWTVVITLIAEVA